MVTNFQCNSLKSKEAGWPVSWNCRIFFNIKSIPDRLSVKAFNFQILDIVPFAVTSSGNFTIRYETCRGFSEVITNKYMVPFGFQLKEDVSMFSKKWLESKFHKLFIFSNHKEPLKWYCSQKSQANFIESQLSLVGNFGFSHLCANDIRKKHLMSFINLNPHTPDRFTP